MNPADPQLKGSGQILTYKGKYYILLEGHIFERMTHVASTGNNATYRVVDNTRKRYIANTTQTAYIRKYVW